MGIDWVKEASIQRLWPNRLVISIKERTPAAFVQTPAADGAFMLTLVDADGVLLIRNASGPSVFPCSPALHDPKAKQAAASV